MISGYGLKLKLVFLDVKVHFFTVLLMMKLYGNIQLGEPILKTTYVSGRFDRKKKGAQELSCFS